MDQTASGRSFSLMITVHNGKVINDLCAALVLPTDQFVSYDIDDLEWMIPLGMAEVVQLPESLVEWFAQRTLQVLFRETFPQAADDSLLRRDPHEPVECDKCHAIRPFYFGDRTFGRYLCEKCFRDLAMESTCIPSEILESSEYSSYSSAMANHEQVDSEH